MDNEKIKQLKRTPLYEIHLRNKAKMVNFAGWFMPVEYTGILKESRACRRSCVLFDVSHMGEIEISGDKALEFIQYLTTNDAASLVPYRMQYNLFINDRATVIDDFMLYRLQKSFLCVVNASNKDKVLSWLRKNVRNGVDIEDESEKTVLLSLQGPFSQKILEKVSNDSFDNLKYMHFIELSISGIECLISRSGYTGEDGFELYCDAGASQKLWSLFISAGKEFNLELAGLGARDVLRIEAGYPLYGHEINDSINPIEASLNWAVKVKNKDFIGKRIIIDALNNGTKIKRVGFVMKDRGVARAGYDIYKNSKTKIGEVTSGIYSPNIDKFIGMGYVETSYADIGGEILIEIRDRLYRAQICKFPFVKIKTKPCMHRLLQTKYTD